MLDNEAHKKLNQEGSIKMGDPIVKRIKKKGSKTNTERELKTHSLVKKYASLQGVFLSGKNIKAVLGNRKKKPREVSNTSISDSNIRWRNRLCSDNQTDDVAKEVWSFRKELGLVAKGDEGKVIEKLSSMEQRDNAVLVGHGEKEAVFENI